MEPSRYVVGIDLGTTNCAVAFVDTVAKCKSDHRDAPTADHWRVETFLISQWTDWGQLEQRSTLPSFHLELTADELAALGNGLPWESESARFAVGVLARDAGGKHPGRRVASAKSWLSHDGVDRAAEILPWQGDHDVERLSPVEVSSRYLSHIRHAWDQAHPHALLADQDVVITLPASFDEVARELTVAAAKRAGLPRVFLIEEPQAAFYAWIDRHRHDWWQQVTAGQLILVCDIGGGTSDFTLIRVRPAGEHGELVQFHRVAVGDHLILGGDNLDHALARYVEDRLSPTGPLPPRDWERLLQASRVAKEVMLSANAPASTTIHLASEGARVVSGGRSLTLQAAEIETVLVDGFFPQVESSAVPSSGQSGFREFGLPFADDPAITRHLAAFLRSHIYAGVELSEGAGSAVGQNGTAEQSIAAGIGPRESLRPDLVLFNGGVMAAPSLRQRIVDSVAQWFSGGETWAPRILASESLDLAVAQGAAYFGMVRRGEGVRIAANLGRSYYMQVAETPPETVCLIPGSAEAGEQFSGAQTLQMELGAPVQFPLWVSSTRLTDNPGDLVALDRQSLTPLPPIRTVLSRGKKKERQTIEVHIETELSEIGTLGLYCVDANNGQRWKLEFDIRSTLETDREVHTGRGELAGVVDSETVERCCDILRHAFLPSGANKQGPPGNLWKAMKEATGVDRAAWPPSLLREMWNELMELEGGRRLSAAHEAKWLNLVGYCLRPGYGLAVDDWRVSQVWRTVHGKLAFHAPSSRTESLILWRRIAGGLTKSQQQALLMPIQSGLLGKGSKLEAHEWGELWRLAGSLEWLAVDLKQRLIQAAIKQLQQPGRDTQAEVLIWAMGRLGTRVPTYGPLNAVVSSDLAWEVFEQISRFSERQADRARGNLLLAVKQVCQFTGDRYRDLPESRRQHAANWLAQRASPQRYIDAVTVGGGKDDADDVALFGETLPLGIRLIR